MVKSDSWVVANVVSGAKWFNSEIIHNVNCFSFYQKRNKMLLILENEKKHREERNAVVRYVN